jgi:hypothetical protein
MVQAAVCPVVSGGVWLCVVVFGSLVFGGVLRFGYRCGVVFGGLVEGGLRRVWRFGFL